MLRCTIKLGIAALPAIYIQTTRRWLSRSIASIPILTKRQLCPKRSRGRAPSAHGSLRIGEDMEGTIMKDVWQSVPGTRFYSRNGEGLYERLTDQLYLRVDEVDETDAREVCNRFAEAFEARAPVCTVA